MFRVCVFRVCVFRVCVFSVCVFRVCVFRVCNLIFSGNSQASEKSVTIVVGMSGNYRLALPQDRFSHTGVSVCV